MPHGDDLDQRFYELVGQIDADEQRRMRAAATKAARARPPRPRRRRLPASPGRAYDPPRRRPGRMWLAMATVTALIAAAGLVVTFRPGLPAPPAEEAAARAVDAVPRDPFAGSPAARYADGIAGFVLPEARAVGGLSREDVAEGLARVRDLLAAAYLDRDTLRGGDPDAFVAALDPGQRAAFTPRPGADGPGRSWVSSFAPGEAELASDVVKVTGRITLGPSGADGRGGAEVRLDHLIVYAVRRPGRPETVVRVVTHASGEVRIHREGGRLVTWVTSWGADATPARCDTGDGYIHPRFAGEPEPGGGCGRAQET
ncbi:hypothetical protein MF672_043410 [Actinomadura sp. ATCC 31491]|uniref:DUF1707 domain-containing protein n=1 Tax=Actinomadura luzonensis TaxID=2805427 RepID=A0ABT0G8M1_9ACTN|nr:hypothetical protein [Actinomadura luzonensis]MCK2220605.1 hypothetical protein [Actinomadura luzonensis]